MASSRFCKLLLLSSSAVSLVYGDTPIVQNPAVISNSPSDIANGSIQIIYRTITVTTPSDNCALTDDDSINSITSTLAALDAQTSAVWAFNGLPMPISNKVSASSLVSDYVDLSLSPAAPSALSIQPGGPLIPYPEASTTLAFQPGGPLIPFPPGSSIIPLEQGGPVIQYPTTPSDISAISTIQLALPSTASSLQIPESAIASSALLPQTNTIPEFNGLPVSVFDSSTASSVALGVVSQLPSQVELKLSAAASSFVPTQSSSKILSTIQVESDGIYIMKGCFPDDSGTGWPVTDSNPVSSGSSTECVTSCYDKNLNIAGIEGTSCYCSNSLDMTAVGVSESYCMTPCSDNSLLACGNAPSGTGKRDGGHIIVYMIPANPIALSTSFTDGFGTETPLPTVADINGPLAHLTPTGASFIGVPTTSSLVLDVLTKTIIPLGQLDLPPTSTLSVSTTSKPVGFRGPYRGPVLPLNSTQLNTTASLISLSNTAITTLSSSPRVLNGLPIAPSLASNTSLTGLPAVTSELASNTSLPISSIPSITLQTMSSRIAILLGNSTLRTTISVNGIFPTSLAKTTSGEGLNSTSSSLDGLSKPISTPTNLTKATATTSHLRILNSPLGFASPSLESSSSLVHTLSSKISTGVVQTSSVGSKSTTASDYSTKSVAQTRTVVISTASSTTESSHLSSSSASSARNDRIQNGLPQPVAPTITPSSFSSSTKQSSAANSLVASSLPSTLVTVTKSTASSGSSAGTKSTISASRPLSTSTTPLFSSASGIINGPLDLAPPSAAQSAFPTVIMPASQTCTSPILVNGGFESGEIAPWIEILLPNTTSTAKVYQDSTGPGITAFGNYYLNTTVSAGQIQTFYQTVSTCPKTTYVITAYSQVAPQKQGHRSTQPCGIQLCEGVSGKCSAEQVLQEDGFDALSLHFKATSILADVQIMVNCAAKGGHAVNNVYLDEITIT